MLLRESRNSRFPASHFRARKARNKLEFTSKRVDEFLQKYSAKEGCGEDAQTAVKLLAELVHLLRSSDVKSHVSFTEIFEWATLGRFCSDYRVRMLSFHIASLLPLTESRFALMLEKFSAVLIRCLHLIELPDIERVECLKLIAKLFDYYYSATPSFRRLYAADERFRLFFRSALSGVYSLAAGEYDVNSTATFARAKVSDEDNSHSSQRLRIAAAGIFLEAAIRTPFSVVQSFGTSWIVQFFDTFYSTNSKIAFLFHQIFAKLLDSPRLRDVAELHLVIQVCIGNHDQRRIMKAFQRISAPLIDLGFFQQQLRELNDVAARRMNEGLENPAQTLLNIALTWSGLFACMATDLDGRFHDASPLNGQLGVGFYMVFNLAEMHLPDAFNCSLREDFVVEEMCALMAGSDLICDETDLLQCFHVVGAFAVVEAGMVEALCRLIIAYPNDECSIKATLLLSDLLNLGTSYLPREFRLRLTTVPDLVRSAAENFWQHTASKFAAHTGQAVPLNWRVASGKSSAVVAVDAIGETADKSLCSLNNFVLSVSSYRPVSDEAKACHSNIFLTAEHTPINVENSFVLFDRLSQLTKLTRLHDVSTLVEQLQNINIFLLNETAEEVSANVDSTFPLNFKDSDLSVLEQCLLDVSNKIFLNAEPSTPQSPPSSNSVSSSAVPSSVNDETVILQDATSGTSYQQQQLAPINWRFVDQLLQALETTSRSLLIEILQKSSKLLDKCHNFFTIVCNRFLPSRQLLLQSDMNASKFDALYTMNCGRRAYNFVALQVENACQVALTLATLNGQMDWVATTMSSVATAAIAEASISNAEHAFYADLLRTFAVDFCTQLNDKSYMGTFSPKNLLGGNSLYYFAIVRIISRQESAFKVLEKAGVFQIFFELVFKRPESIEYVKLVLSSLDYTRDGIARVILQTAATSVEKRVRKWTTRFLNILVGLGTDSASKCECNVVELALQLAVRQLSDESPKVARLAGQVLIDWLPRRPQHIELLKNVEKRRYGDIGRLLEGVYVGLSDSVDDTLRAEVLNYWMKEFNARYVEIIEDEMRRLNLNVKRSLKGRFARSSQPRSGKRVLRPPPHFLGMLARCAAGRLFLARQKVPLILLMGLRRFRRRMNAGQYRAAQASSDDEQYTELEADCRAVKAALLAAAQIIGHSDKGLLHDNSEILEQILFVIADFASACGWLSVRGCALWALNIAGRSELGTHLLETLGWERGPSSVPSANPLNKHYVKFACGEFVWARPHQLHCRPRRRAHSCDSTGDRESNINDSHFLRHSISQPNLQFVFSDSIVSEQAATAAAVIVPSRDRATSLRDKFLNDGEQTHLITYRDLLATGNMPNSDVDAYGFVRIPTVATTATVAKKTLTILYLPSHISAICSNVFRSRREVIPLRVLPSPSLNFAAHVPLRCLFCCTRHSNPNNIDEDIARAYKKYGAEILRLLHRIQVRLTEMDNRDNEQSTSGEKQSENGPATKSEEVTQTNVALKLQMRLLRIYTEAPKAFAHPCLFSDVLFTMAEYRLNAPHRRFIHQLFFSAQL